MAAKSRRAFVARGMITVPGAATRHGLLLQAGREVLRFVPALNTHDEKFTTDMARTDTVLADFAGSGSR